MSKLNAETIKKGLQNFINNTPTKIYYPGGDNLIADALALIDKLTNERDRYKRYYLNHDYDRMEANIKAEAVREMHSEIEERCIKGGIYPAFVKRTIDNIAREKLEGKE